jgi:outer membrane protein OmpA-like peptidoglycan-associated protein/tetratricopeptide (TPR) repeat protein
MVMMKKYILSFSILLLAGMNICAQITAKEAQAEKLYTSFSYVKAAKLYKQLADQNINPDYTIKRLADCYNKIGDYKNAESSYSKLYESGKADAEEIYAYSQALKSNGKYKESEQILDKFYYQNKSDTRGIEHTSKKGALDKILNDKPYFDIKNLDINSKMSDFSAAYNGDKVVFASNRGKNPSVVTEHTWNEQPFLDLYSANKDAQGNLSMPAKLNKRVNTKYHEGPAAYTTDGKYVYITRNNYFNSTYKKSSKGVNNLKLYRGKQVNGEWVFDDFPYNNDEYSVGHPSVSSDGKTLFFVSDMPGGMGGTDVYNVAVNDDGSYGEPKNLGKVINSEGNEMFPFIHENGTLFFSSNGHVGLGGLDVFAAQGKAGKYSKITNLAQPLNSGLDDFAFAIDKDMKQAYVSSNRDGGKGGDDIYLANMLRPLKQTYSIKGIAIDQFTKKPVEGAAVVLTDNSGTKIGETKTGPGGNYNFEVEPQQNYKLAGTKEKYFPGENPFNTNELGDEKTELVKDVDLIPDMGFSVYGIITGKKDKAPLQDVKVTVKELESGKEVLQTMTPAAGDFRKILDGAKLNDKIAYAINLEKAGYMTKSVPFAKTLTKPGEYKIHEEMDLGMDKIEVGLDLAKIIDIKPIFFDLGKFNIRKDAAIELDKIVKVMTENPTMVVELGSHTDCRSSIASNMKLSDARAKASAAYITSKGVGKDRLYGKGYGEEKLINGCACEGAVKSTCTEAEHQANRRTEFIIVKM